MTRAGENSKKSDIKFNMFNDGILKRNSQLSCLIAFRER